MEEKITRDDKWVRLEDRINLSWARANSATARNIINVGVQLMHYMDRSRYFVHRQRSQGLITFRLRNLESGEWEDKIVIDESSHSVMNMRAKEAIFNPFFYLVAHLMGYYDMDKKWEQLGIIGKTKDNTIVLQKNMDSEKTMIQIQNRYPNPKFGEEEVEILYKFKAKMERYRNLRPFYRMKWDKLAQITVKSIKKDRMSKKRRRNQL